MDATVVVNVRMAPATREVLDRLGTEHGLTRSAIIRRALGIMQAVDDARKFGRYVGTTMDRECLETVIVTPI